MQIPPLTQLPTLTPVIGAPERQAWQTGQILKALVQSVNQQDSALLSIGNRQVQVQMQTPLRPGQELLIKIVGSSERPQFQLLTPPTSTPRLIEALRVSIPQQQPLAPLLANLLSLTAAKETTQTLGKALHAAAQEMRRQIAQPQQLAAPKTLRQAVQKSGLFLERQLMEGARPNQPSPGADLKGALLRLYQVLTALTQTARPSTSLPQLPVTPPPLKNSAPQAQPTAKSTVSPEMPIDQLRQLLMRQVEGALHRVQLNQLASLPTEEGGRTQLMLEIPVQSSQQEVRTLQLQIEDETTSTDPDAEHRWTVTLAMDFEGLGPVFARITVMGDQVSTTLFAEQEETVQQFEQRIEQLQQGFERAGLSIGRILCRQGHPPATITDPHPNLVSQRV